jgi:hypothetical protein
MPTFIRAQQDEKYRIHNMPVNIEHVKAIKKAMNGFYYAIIFQFNESQSFEWKYRYSNDRDADYERLTSIIEFQSI